MATGAPGSVPLHAKFSREGGGLALEDAALTAVVFGSALPAGHDPRILSIDLEPLGGDLRSEIWVGGRRPSAGVSGSIRYVENGEHLAGWLRLDEDRAGGLQRATETAYREILAFLAASGYPQLWRAWNVLAAINEGSGDEERYRQFCVGRARAFTAVQRAADRSAYPAASAVGRQRGPRTLEILWIAGREPGLAIENPRQLSAYRYPRRYGPASPSFSRAMVIPGPMLLVSGTASIVGHESVHHGDVARQATETIGNLDALLEHATATGHMASARLGAGSLVRAYVRHPRDAVEVRDRLRSHFGDAVQLLVLAADICRPELLLEVELVHRD